MPQVFISVLQVQKRSRNNLKGAFSHSFVFALIYFCFSPNATEHYISFCLKKWHDMKRERQCKGVWLLEEMDLFEAKGNWTPLSVFLLAFYSSLPDDLSQRIIKFKELRSYLRHYLLVDNESIGSLVTNQLCYLCLLPLVSPSAEGENIWSLEYRYTLT